MASAFDGVAAVLGVDVHSMTMPMNPSDGSSARRMDSMPRSLGRPNAGSMSRSGEVMSMSVLKPSASNAALARRAFVTFNVQENGFASRAPFHQPMDSRDGSARRDARGAGPRAPALEQGLDGDLRVLGDVRDIGIHLLNCGLGPGGAVGGAACGGRGVVARHLPSEGRTIGSKLFTFCGCRSARGARSGLGLVVGSLLYRTRHR